MKKPKLTQNQRERLALILRLAADEHFRYMETVGAISIVLRELGSRITNFDNIYDLCWEVRDHVMDEDKAPDGDRTLQGSMPFWLLEAAQRLEEGSWP